MKIRVSYAELRTEPGFNNQRAEAEIEVEVKGDVKDAYARAWLLVKTEVKKQLDSNFEEDLPF